MESIRSLFARPIERNIEEVIKVNQANEEVVLNELQEYVATDSIKEHFRTVYDEIIQVARNPRDGIGVWVSGFFGSGKSSFAKILGYTVGARQVGNKSASEIFKQNVKDKKISGMLDIINQTLPTHAVIFDVSMDRGVRTASESIKEIIYKALLRELDYAEDFDLAELEITLEGDGRLEDFRKRFQDTHGKPWEQRRKVGLGINEASAILHEMDSVTYPQRDSWARTLGFSGTDAEPGRFGRADIDANRLAERAFELASRREPGKALIFIIDEVGQYVSRSVDKMLDLQGVVQALGMAGVNRVKDKKAVAPFWIVVTSQEKLNEIVDALDSKKIELARLQDRFRIPIDLKQTDIPEITGKRVLEKNSQGKTTLEQLYAANEGRLKTFCTLERTSRNVSLTKKDFIALYPYLPYQIDLCIDIVSGLRLKRGAHRHIGGSNRTIIKQAQEMMVNPRTRLADAPVGTLVTLDKVYELLYLGNLLPTEISHEIDAIVRQFPGDDMALRVAKAIALLESVKDLPRTVHNLSVVLHPSVEAESIQKDVEAALKQLEKAQIIRDTEEGYKLLSAQEKTWDTQRNALEPKPADRNRILREFFRNIFADPKIKSYKYSNMKPFRAVLWVEGELVESDGQVPLKLLLAQDTDDFPLRCAEARESSLSNSQEVYWVVTFSEEIHQHVQEAFRSREMVSNFERHAAQGKLTPEEASCLAEEKMRQDRYQRELRTRLSDALKSGSGFFRGVQKDSSVLGQSLPDVLAKLFDWIIPDLYPKLEMGIRPLKGTEARDFLMAVNLNGLSPVFYDGDNGLNLVTKQGGKFVPNLAADVCREILAYLLREHKYGNKVTGKMLESHFQGLGYGWDGAVIHLVLAVLLRGGAVEVTHQGRKYRNYNDPACREPFANVPKFRAASFAPREPIDLRILADAARNFEEITGKEVEIEEGDIAEAFKTLAHEDREKLLPLVAGMRALKLPGLEFIENHLQTVEGILDMPADDCVRTLAGEGKSYKEARLRAARLAEALTDDSIELMKKAHQALNDLWPVLAGHEPTVELRKRSEELSEQLESDQFFESLEAIKQATAAMLQAYRNLYEGIHQRRAALYEKALESVKGLPEWAVIDQDQQLSEKDKAAFLSPLSQRLGGELDLPDGAAVCQDCKATVAQMETDMAAVDAIRERVINQILEQTREPDERIERVRISALFSGKLENEKDVEEALNTLKDYLLKIVSSGASVVLE